MSDNTKTTVYRAVEYKAPGTFEKFRTIRFLSMVLTLKVASSYWWTVQLETQSWKTFAHGPWLVVPFEISASLMTSCIVYTSSTLWMYLVSAIWLPLAGALVMNLVVYSLCKLLNITFNNLVWVVIELYRNFHYTARKCTVSSGRRRVFAMPIPGPGDGSGNYHHQPAGNGAQPININILATPNINHTPINFHFHGPINIRTNITNHFSGPILPGNSGTVGPAATMVHNHASEVAMRQRFMVSPSNAAHTFNPQARPGATIPSRYSSPALQFESRTNYPAIVDPDHNHNEQEAQQADARIGQPQPRPRSLYEGSRMGDPFYPNEPAMVANSEQGDPVTAGIFLVAAGIIIGGLVAHYGPAFSAWVQHMVQRKYYTPEPVPSVPKHVVDATVKATERLSSHKSADVNDLGNDIYDSIPKTPNTPKLPSIPKVPKAPPGGVASKVTMFFVAVMLVLKEVLGK